MNAPRRRGTPVGDLPDGKPRLSPPKFTPPCPRCKLPMIVSDRGRCPRCKWELEP